MAMQPQSNTEGWSWAFTFSRMSMAGITLAAPHTLSDRRTRFKMSEQTQIPTQCWKLYEYLGIIAKL